MAYIYKIENQKNGKIYIGKTLKSIQERMETHIRDSQRVNIANRPLYKAFKKYGIENFSISVVEECSEEVVNEREIYWIEMYGSFKYGYNATCGGDGKRYCDYDLIYALYEEGKNVSEISCITHYDEQTCRVALDNKGITHEMRVKRGREKIIKPVLQLDVCTNEIIGIYSSIQEAYDSLGKQRSGHIASVCNGKRKTAYGYKWRYKI